MNDLFLALLLISIIILVIGIKKPLLFSRIFKKEMTKKKIGLIFGGIAVIFFILFGITSETTPPKETPPPTTNQSDEQSTQKETPPPTANQPDEQTQAAQKESAQKELSEIIELGKKADLVVSCEFSDSATVVYIGPTWYTQTVAFKKDFIAKIGMLKKQITGYTHFEVRDAYSNEKVGEIKAFSQSIEVYK